MLNHGSLEITQINASLPKKAQRQMARELALWGIAANIEA